MRKLLLFATAAMLLQTTAGMAQNCCRKPAGMQELAMNIDFKGAHEAPLPFTYESDNGEDVTFTTPDNNKSKAFYLPSKSPTDKVVIIFHEWWGLNDYIKREAENIQKKLGGNLEVYAVDLYDGNVATTPDEAGKMMGGLKPERAMAIINGLMQKIGKDKKVVTLGWCMGGSWSFAGTLAAGAQAKGCVMYYGFPDADKEHIKNLKADVLYIRGTEDGFITKESVDEFGKNVKSLTKVKYTQKDFKAVHAFANPSNPKYDVKAATEAMDISIKFIKEHLNIK